MRKNQKLGVFIVFASLLLYSCNLAFYNPFANDSYKKPAPNQVAAPALSPSGGTFSSDQAVTITCNTPDAKIFYSTNGSPALSYSASIPVAGNGNIVTITAYATKAGMTDSAVASGTFTISYNRVGTPVMNPAGGTYDSDQNVAITCEPGAVIRYTINDPDLKITSPVYSSPIPVALNGTIMTIRAYATKTGMADSAVASATYTIAYKQVATPLMSPAGGTYDTDQNVTITCEPGAVIRYTTNNPDLKETSPVYSDPIPVALNGTIMTIRAYATKTGMADSAMATATYTIAYNQVETPVMHPAGGTYSMDQSVTITCVPSDAIIRYTTSGIAPDENSPIYSSPIQVNSNTTIMAYATKAGMLQSSVKTENYIINYGQVSTPSITPVGTTYNTDKYVTITCDTDGSSIYYTTNGDTPTSSSTPYGGPFLVTGPSKTTVVKAIAYNDPMTPSPIRTETYVIQWDTVQTPVISPEGKTYQADQPVTITCGTDGAVIHYTTNGDTPTASSPTYAGAILVTEATSPMTISAIGVKDGNISSDIASATYTVQWPTVATPVLTPGSNTYNSNQSVTISCDTPGAKIYYTINGPDPTTTSTPYSGLIPVAGDNTTTIIKAIGICTGYHNSAVASATYIIQWATVATPAISPATGTYGSDQTVTITCTGAEIRYTMDGTDPTTSSTLYTGPVSTAGHSSPVTVKAIGIKSGMRNSAIAGATYTIQIWNPLGTQGFSAGGAAYTSLYVYNGTPYVAYQDQANSNKATVMYYNGSSWQNYGNAGFSAGSVTYTSLYFNGSTAYVAFADGANSNKVTVMSYNGTSWGIVGIAGFSAGAASYVSLCIQGGTPYVAYKDGGNSNKATVMSYNSSWQNVGSAGFSTGPAEYVSLGMSGSTPYVAYMDNYIGNSAIVKTFNGSSWDAVPIGGAANSGNSAYTSLYVYSGTPYLAFQDASHSNYATVVTYNGSSWAPVGNAGFTTLYDIMNTSLFVSSGVPYVATQRSGTGKATVWKYNGSTWGALGSTDFSPGAANYISLFVYNGTPYLAYCDAGNSNKATVMKL
jgi:hypothetical protein